MHFPIVLATIIFFENINLSPKVIKKLEWDLKKKNKKQNLLLGYIINNKDLVNKS